jgi:hypothetical protein
MGCQDVCGGGQCLQGCNGFPDECDGACTDVDVDPLNCGDCGDACDADQLCSNGDCRDFFAAPCDMCPCDDCPEQCCFSGFLDAAVCLEGGGCP